MPDKKSPENDDAKGGGAKKIAIAAVLCVGLLGGGYFAAGMTSGASETPVASAAESEAAAVEEKKEIGELVDLEPVNVNLQDGHFLRVAIALEVSHGDEGEAAGGHGKEEEVAFPLAPAQDIVLSTFSGRSMPELAASDGREAARAELIEAIVGVYGEKITTVYLTEFVMQ